MLILDAFIAAVGKRIDEEDASIARPLRAGALEDLKAYGKHAGQLAAFDKVREILTEEHARLTQPQHKASKHEENDD
jgi:hypothetical protein